MVKKLLLGLVVLVLLLGVGGYLYYKFVLYVPPLISEEDRASIHMMPLPAKLVLTGGSYKLTTDFNVIIEGSSPRLEKAKVRFLNTLSEVTGFSFSGKGKGLRVVCPGENSQYPQLGTDESYDLKVTSSGLVLEANTEFGVMHGLQTIIQLVGGSFIPQLELKDKPRFPWRGIMIDVSRHWIPKQVILRNLDAMAAVKMNVLHIHLSDDQGFRLESTTFPLLHEIGSNGKYYTQDDMREIINHAADRGIRIVPEFDVPGHTKSWLMAYPELGSSAIPLAFGRSKGEELFSVPLDPSNEQVYEFLDGFIGEMAELFPDKYFHIGGDEVSSKYWDENEEIRTFMANNNLADGHALQAYFNSRLNPIVKKYGKTMLGWEEILHPDLSTDVVIQSWTNQKTLFQGVQRGSQGILSAGYYLDHKLHAGKHYAIDPLNLPGAIDIKPDSDRWRMHDIVMDVPGGPMESKIVIFDRDNNNVFGYLALLDQRNAFQGGKIAGDELAFTFITSFGELGFKATLDNDSIAGQISFGLLRFDTNGRRSGGSDMPGTEMPRIEIIKPLTEDEKARVLGVEAAMWSEVVSDITIDSRLWPRSAAIAEKLWSPQELTIDENDMYRRLPSISEQLELLNITHISYVDEIVASWGLSNSGPVKDLLDVLEEAKYYNRLSIIINADEIYIPDLALNHVADAANPESRQGRAFNLLVEEYSINPGEESKTKIRQQLETWAGLYVQLQPAFDSSEIFSEAKNITQAFSEVSKLALNNVENGLEAGDEHIEATLALLENGENGIVVSVVPGLRALLLSPDNP